MRPLILSYRSWLWPRANFSSHVKSNLKELTATSSVPETKIRNIGIIAHIDAGKTTTTERMLHLSGLTRTVGKVDSGDTVMDFMPQERERGITISLAAITFPWNGFRINLIDTPGHVDFTVEVERSLLAMDGVVIILDASKGVQAQTQTVWRQAKKFGLPAIVFLNKMDKPGANVLRCISQLKSKLGLTTLPLQIPPNEIWNTIKPLFGSLVQSDYMDEKRKELFEVIADLDDKFAQVFLDDDKSLLEPEAERVIAHLCHQRLAAPLLMGSSLKGQGVSELLNAVTQYLPNPFELEKPTMNERLRSTSGVYGLAFKNIYHKQKGLLTFLRLYRGSIKPGTSLFNANKCQKEKVNKIMEVYADELRDVQAADAGNIVVVSGLKQTDTGDTLVDAAHSEEAQSAHLQPLLRIPDPVFFCSIEAGSISQQKALEDALEIVQAEDPSVKVRTDADVGQLIISGMGELHLEIIRDRLKQEFGLEVFLGPLQVAYKESPSLSIEKQHNLSRDIQSIHYKAGVSLKLIPRPVGGSFKKLIIHPERHKHVHKDILQAVENGVSAGLSNGVLMGCPVVDVDVELVSVETSRGIPTALVALTATQCVQAMLQEAQCKILEPLMNVAITLPTELVHDVMGDLSKRRALIKEIEMVDEGTRTIVSETPLSEMLHFSRDIRTLSHGMASFSIEFGRYEVVDQNQLQKIQNRFV